MKLKIDTSPQLVRDDGRPLHPYDILSDWLRRMKALHDEEVKCRPEDTEYYYALSLREDEWAAVRSYFAQFAYEAAASPEGDNDPLRAILAILEIPLPDLEVEEEDRDDA